MDKNEVRKALCLLSSGDVEFRRKSITPAAIVLLAGVACIIGNTLISDNVELSGIKSGLMATGITLAAFGALMLAIRVAGATDLHHRSSNQRIKLETRFFPRESRGALMEAIDRGDVGALLGMKESHVAQLTLVVARTPDDSYLAVQAFEYAELEDKPLSEPKVLRA